MDREPVKLLYWAAGLSIGASLVHGALIEEHLSEWWAFGAFFMLASATQGLYGFAILSSHLMNGSPISERWPLVARRWFYLAGIAGNGLLVLMYVMSRTIGVPLGPEAGEIEAWDALGVMTKLLELGVIGCLVLLYAGASRSDRAPVERPAGS